jgi:hypothetical protein
VRSRWVRALLVITAGVTTDPVLADGLAAAVARHGMRLVGPNSPRPGQRRSRGALAGNVRTGCGSGQVGVAAQPGGVMSTVLSRRATRPT